VARELKGGRTGLSEEEMRDITLVALVFFLTLIGFTLFNRVPFLCKGLWVVFLYAVNQKAPHSEAFKEVFKPLGSRAVIL